MSERLYIVTYDIANQKRGRAVFKLMHGYGEWMQLSVFQCRLSAKRHAELIATLDQIIHHKDDHVLIMDVGKVELVEPRIVSLGKTWEAVKKEPLIV